MCTRVCASIPVHVHVQNEHLHAYYVHVLHTPHLPDTNDTRYNPFDLAMYSLRHFAIYNLSLGVFVLL